MNMIRRNAPIRYPVRTVLQPFSPAMGPFSTHRGQFGAPDLGRLKPPEADDKDIKALEARERRRKTRGAAGSGLTSVSTAYALTAPPWTTILAAVPFTLGSALSLSAAFGKRGSKALAGDKSVVRHFAKRAARWSSAKRARVADKLWRQYKQLKARLGKKEGRKGLLKKRHARRVEEGKVGVKIRKKMAIRRLKLEVLYALEARARHSKKHALLKDDPSSVPEEVENDTSSNEDDASDAEDTSEEMATVTPEGSMSPTTMLLIGGGIAAALGVAVVLSRSHGSAAPAYYPPSATPRATVQM